VSGSGEDLVCPSCGRRHAGARERFCESCGMPLVREDAERRLGERELRARKIKPQYGEGRLVKVARAINSAEAEFIENLLLEEGIPSVLMRSAGVDVPEFGAVGARDVLVPESGAEAAREALTWERPDGSSPPPG
jgi:Putative prokaryotic signal transducing protein